MGWLWSSSPKGDSDSSTDSTPPSTTLQSAPEPAPPCSQPDNPPAPRTRDEAADLELQKFLEEINYSPSSYDPKSLTPSTTTTTTNASPSSPPPKPTHSGPPPSPISPATLYPTSMSCRSAFDAAYHCQLPGGQFVNVYRYGELRNCSQLWSDFWFCMRTNRGYMSEEERGKRIKQFYWERDRKYRESASSENVWEMRKDRVVGAFEGDLRAAEEAEGAEG